MIFIIHAIMINSKYGKSNSVVHEYILAFALTLYVCACVAIDNVCICEDSACV